MVRPRTTTAMSMDPYREPASLVVVRTVLAEAEAEAVDLVVELESVGVPEVVRFDDDVVLEAGSWKGGVELGVEDSEPEDVEFDPDLAPEELEDDEDAEAADPDAVEEDPEAAEDDAVAVAEALTLEEEPSFEISMLCHEPVLSPYVYEVAPVC